MGDGETGLVVAEPRDAALTAAALGRLIRDPEQAARQGRAARARAVQLFSYDVLANRLRDALDTLSAGR